MYDLILTNGRVLDPSREIDQVADVAFQNGKVAKIAPQIDRETKQRRDMGGSLVTPGLIDLHTHVYWLGTSIGVDPNRVSRMSGCTTLVDAGTAGAGNLAGFHEHIVKHAEPRVLAFVNISFPGIFAFGHNVMVGECADLSLLSSRDCLQVASENLDWVVGIKARVGKIAGGGNGIGPLDMAIEVADELRLPVMAHLDFPPPSRKEVLDRLRSKDIVTHCFRPFPNAPVRGTGEIHEEVLRARDRGVVFDLGHGCGSFGFDTAKAMLENGFRPDVLSSDVHLLSIDGPAFHILDSMSKFLCLGLPLNEVIRATTEAPAKAINRPDLGNLQEGSPGDASVLEIIEGRFRYVDVLDQSIDGTQKFKAKGRVIAGQWFDCADE